MRVIYPLFLVFSLSLMFSSCEPVDEDTTDTKEQSEDTADTIPEENTPEDNTPNNNDTDEESGTFQLFFNDSLVREGSTDEVGMRKGISSTWGNIVTLDNGTIIQLFLSGFSFSTGEDVVLNDGSPDEPVAMFIGWDILYKDVEELYYSVDGKLTRTSGSKISFEGRCTEMLHPLDTVNFRGYYESEAFKEIK